MRSRFRSHVSYANVMATVAVFVALSGSSYAALKVGSKQIVNNSIRSKDLKNNNVRSGDVRNGSLLARDFRPGQLPAGPQGSPGAPGSPGMSGYQITFSEVESHPSGTQLSAQADCPAGKRAVGGGPNSGGFGHNISTSYPAPGGTAWKVIMNNTSGFTKTFRVYAVCVNVAN